MSTSTAIADVQAKGTGPEGRGKQRECLPFRLRISRLAPMRYRDEPL
jgi:hypothetical protein